MDISGRIACFLPFVLLTTGIAAAPTVGSIERELEARSRANLARGVAAPAEISQDQLDSLVRDLRRTFPGAYAMRPAQGQIGIDLDADGKPNLLNVPPRAWEGPEPEPLSGDQAEGLSGALEGRYSAAQVVPLDQGEFGLDLDANGIPDLATAPQGALGYFDLAAVGPQRRSSVTDVANAAMGECHDSIPLGDSPTVDERMTWASSVSNCLEDVAKSLEAKLYVSSDAEKPEVVKAKAEVEEVKAKTDASKAQAEGEKDFLGMKWGVGVGYSYAVDDVVDNAQVVDGKIRVTKDLRAQPRLIMEFHRYIGCYEKNGKEVQVTSGCGPFAAIVSRDDKVLSGVAFGGMYGWKTTEGDVSKGFSVGLGVLLDSEGKTLASGFDDGQALPDGATAIVFEDEARWSAVLFFTRTF